MNNYYAKSVIFLSIVTFFSGCDRRPQNLTTAKDLVIEYYEQGDFEKDVKNAVDAAIRFFRPRICCGPESAVVFDIDDTLLWSYYEMKHIQFGYVPKLFHEWVIKANTPVVPHVKRLYDFFVARGCTIIMLTGRRFDEREATVENLRKEGFTKIDLLITRSDSELTMSALEFKSRHRQILENKGYRIIATIGDQESDLKGGYAHYKVKIPNYTYIVN
jgi:predicted secreted acid phosphatase